MHQCLFICWSSPNKPTEPNYNCKQTLLCCGAMKTSPGDAIQVLMGKIIFDLRKEILAIT